MRATGPASPAPDRRDRDGLTCCAAGVILLLAALAGAAPPPSGALRGHDVLLIQSYDQLMSWTANIRRGIVDTLAVDGARMRLAVENLDAKIHNAPAYFEAYRRMLAVKYADTRFDLVLTADNHAFEFMRRHRDELFPGTPVVFGGLNGFDPVLLEGFEGVTGVAEVYSARETVALALRQFPRTRRVYLLNDDLVTGRAVAGDIARQLADLAPAVTVEHAPALSLAGHQARLGALPPDTIVLLGVFYADRDDHHTTFEAIGRELAAASNAPVYCVLAFNVSGGVLGGRLVSGYWQGVAMARLARQVLGGADPAALPVVAERANRFIFDHAQLVRWRLEERDLPAGSIVVNRPFSVWRTYRRQIIGLAVLMSLLLLCIAGLVLNIRRRRETEVRLRRSEERLAITLRSIGDAVVATDREGLAAFLKKPYRQGELLRALARITGGAQGSA